MEVKMYLHEDYEPMEMEEVYVDEWEKLGIPREASLAFVENRPTYEVELVLDYDPDTSRFDLVRVNGLGDRSYEVKST